MKARCSGCGASGVPMPSIVVIDLPSASTPSIRQEHTILPSQMMVQAPQSPAADSVPALYAAGAIAVVVGSKGRREVPVEQIPTSPGRTSLAKDEFILEFKFPPRPPHSGDAYLRFIPRTEMDIAVVGCGINLTLDDKGVCTAARVALGAVAPTVLLVKEAADALIGHTLDEETLKKLDAAARAACKPINDKRGTIEYRTKVAGVLARRVAAIAFDRAMGKTQGKTH